jgi:hypothetical protein
VVPHTNDKSSSILSKDEFVQIVCQALAIKKARLHFCNRALLLLKNPAIPTFALVGTIIGSESLTTVFGMGTGGPFGYGHRERNTVAVADCVP